MLLFTYAYDPSGAIKILIFSNLGYVTCHVFAMSGFLLLRRDRPNWPRPIKVNSMWLPIAGALAAFDLLLLVWGGWNSGLAYGNTSKTIVFEGIGVLVHRRGAVHHPGRVPGQAEAGIPSVGADNAG